MKANLRAAMLWRLLNEDADAAKAPESGVDELKRKARLAVGTA